MFYYRSRMIKWNEIDRIFFLIRKCDLYTILYNTIELSSHENG